MYNRTYPYDLLSKEMFSTKFRHFLFYFITFSLKHHTFYIILKLHGNAFCFWIAWVPYVFTSFSNINTEDDDQELLEYHTFLHHSQTRNVRLTTLSCLSTIRFYIILKLFERIPNLHSAWVPYVFTSFSNQYRDVIWAWTLEYHTFLHHSQTRRIFFRQCDLLEYHTFLHHSQTCSVA